MKRLAVALIFTCLSVWTFAQSTAFLAGHIDNPKSGQVYVMYEPSPIHTEPERFEATLNESGDFSMEIILDHAREVRFSHGREYASLFLHPADQVEMSLDAESFDETITFAGSTPGVAASAYLAQELLQFQDRESMAVFRKKLSEAGSIEELTDVINQRHGEKVELWQQFQGGHEVSDAFKTHIDYGLTYEAYLNRLQIPNYFRRMQEMESGEDVEIPEGYYDFLGKISIQQPEALGVANYVSFVSAYLSHILEVELEGGEEANQLVSLCALAEDRLEGPVQSLLIANFIKEGLNYGDPTGLDEYFYSLSDLENGETYQTQLKPLLEAAMRIATGNQAPGFTLKDQRGKDVSLADFKGKVIYLDFWASWCGPCRREMPYSRELISEFADNEDLVFLFISIDDDKDAWNRARAEEELDGVHLYTKGFSSETPQAYNINAIPNYFLIGRDGKIVSPAPPRPSDPSLRDLLKETLRS